MNVAQHGNPPDCADHLYVCVIRNTGKMLLSPNPVERSGSLRRLFPRSREEVRRHCSECANAYDESAFIDKEFRAVVRRCLVGGPGREE